jgi:hypothetical protein
MKKFDVKSIIVGLVICIIGAYAVFTVVEKKSAVSKEKKVIATSEGEKKTDVNEEKDAAIFTGERIKSADINNGQIYFDGKEVKLKKPLVTIVKEGNHEPELYIPMEELLEYMQFNFEWNCKDNAVYLTMNGPSKTAGNEGNDATGAADEEIKSADINTSKVYYNGKDIGLKKPLVTITKEENSKPKLYMPMDELLEYMHFKVEWNTKDNALYLIMNGQNKQENTEIKPNSSENETDKEAIEIMQKTENWGYIEKYLPRMSADGIQKVVDIYNSKHLKESQHKNASDYIKN